MKIVLLCRSLDVGGTERQIVILAKALHQQGYDITVVVFYGNGAFMNELHASGTPVVDLRKTGRWDLFPFFVRVVRAVSRLKPTVIYGFLGIPNIITVVLKSIFPKIKIVWGVRSSKVELNDYDWLLRLSYKAECWLSRFSDLCICNSHAGLEYAAANGFPRERMVVVHNGIDTHSFRPNADARNRLRAELGIAEKGIFIGLVARLDPIKDHSTFLRAAALLSAERDDVSFVCVGDGADQYQRELRRLAKGLGLERNLVWTGSRQDMPDIYNALDVACSTSYGEGFSNAIVEAMSCGVPCIVTDVGDSATIVGGTGIVVPPASPADMHNAFQLMLKQISPAIGLAARASIEERYSNEQLVSNTLKFLCRI